MKIVKEVRKKMKLDANERKTLEVAILDYADKTVDNMDGIFKMIEDWLLTQAYRMGADSVKKRKG